MTRFLVFAALCLVTVVALMGIRGTPFTQPPLEVYTDMKRQPKVKAQAESPFFADGRTSQKNPAGTIPTVPGHLAPQIQDHFSTDTVLTQGKNADGSWAQTSPLPVTLASLEAGRGMYERTCALCHGYTGNGRGVTYGFGINAAATLQDTRLRQMADGEIFNTITHGKGLMYGLGNKFTPTERWQIVAYLRALQDSQNVKMDELPQAP